MRLRAVPLLQGLESALGALELISDGAGQRDGAFVFVVREQQQGREHLLVGAFLPRTLQDIVLARRIADPGQVLLYSKGRRPHVSIV